MSTTIGDETDDPIEYFLEEQRFHGKSERTLVYYRRVLRDFEEYLADPDRNASGSRTAIAAAGRRECMGWVHELRGRVSGSTVATYASYLHRFYAYMTEVGTFDANPMTLVMEELDEQIDVDPTRRDISIPRMQTFMEDISHPLDRALVMTLLKTGMRVGELCNLDLRDLTMDHPAREAYDVSPRAALDGRRNALFVDSTPRRGGVHNNERRTASNKRQRDTVIPVDDGLLEVLVRWLSVRPDALSPATPLFVNTRERWGQRVEPNDVRYIVERHARDFGWYHTGGGAEENVTPHYFRHFFTTHLRDSTGDRGVVKYLRGDVADDVLDTYTHDWGDQVRTVYEANIYSLT